VVSTPKPKKDGYVRVGINGKHHLLHRLIAIAFDLPKEDDQDTVDHIDNDPSNNRKENLRWANQSEQIERSYATNEERGSSAPKRSKPVEWPSPKSLFTSLSQFSRMRTEATRSAVACIMPTARIGKVRRVVCTTGKAREIR
jgi:hypothetical protein